VIGKEIVFLNAIASYKHQLIKKRNLNSSLETIKADFNYKPSVI